MNYETKKLWRSLNFYFYIDFLNNTLEFIYKSLEILKFCIFHKQQKRKNFKISTQLLLLRTVLAAIFKQKYYSVTVMEKLYLV